jgi:hypothetical protein
LLATSTNSSPLNTPEVVNCTLENVTTDTGEYEADLEDNQEKDGDKDLLLGAPKPETIAWPTEEIPSPPLDPAEQIERSACKTPKPASFPAVSIPVKLLMIRLPALQTITQSPASCRMSSTATPGWFHGKPDKNAQNFLKEVDRYIILSDLKTEAAKVIVFSTLLSAGSIADLWWTKLDSSKKTTWADVQKEFASRWPVITIAEKTGLNYQREILALCLDKEELGMQVVVAGVPTWVHLQFHAWVQQLISEAGMNATAGLVYQVRENLPMVIKELTTPGVTEWTKFLEEIKGLDMNKLREKAEAGRKKREVEKAQNARLDSKVCRQMQSKSYTCNSNAAILEQHSQESQCRTPQPIHLPMQCLAYATYPEHQRPDHQHDNANHSHQKRKRYCAAESTTSCISQTQPRASLYMKNNLSSGSRSMGKTVESMKTHSSLSGWAAQ